MVVPFYHLQKERGSVLHGLGEDLQKVAIVIKIYQNLQLLQLQVHTMQNNPAGV